MSKPPVSVSLRWDGDLAFVADPRAHGIVVDGNGARGASPVQLLGLALAGCMGTDVALILTRGRQPLRGLEVQLSADRAPEDPHRLTAVRIHFAVEGAVDPARLERAMALSRDKYCSVWHSIRPDVTLELTSTIQA